MENFEVKILELVARGELKKGQLVNFDVRHDDWCDRLNKVGPCNCDPKVLAYPARDSQDFVTTYLALRNSYRKH